MAATVIIDGLNTKNHRLRKNSDGDLSEITRNESKCFHLDHLTVAIVAARRTSNVRWHFAAALGAALEDRGTPTRGATAHFLTAFGLAALWNGHSLELV
jgi:hypothetical protein